MFYAGIVIGYGTADVEDGTLGERPVVALTLVAGAGQRHRLMGCGGGRGGELARAVVAGFVVAKTGRYRPVMWVGWVAMNLGYVSVIRCFSCNQHLLIDRDS